MAEHHIDDHGRKLYNLQDVTSSKQNELIDDLLTKLERLPRQRFANEERSHYYLWGKLEEWYPNLRRIDEAHGKEIDILLNDQIAIEIKNFTEDSVESELNRLIGQITRHSNKYKYYVAIIFGGTGAHKKEIEALPKEIDNVFVVVK